MGHLEVNCKLILELLLWFTALPNGFVGEETTGSCAEKKDFEVMCLLFCFWLSFDEQESGMCTGFAGSLLVIG